MCHSVLSSVNNTELPVRCPESDCVREKGTERGYSERAKMLPNSKHFTCSYNMRHCGVHYTSIKSDKKMS